jgi:hypothetical protein
MIVVIKNKAVVSVKEATGTISSIKRNKAAEDVVAKANKALNLLGVTTGEDYLMFYCDILKFMGDDLIRFSGASSVSPKVAALMTKLGKNIKQTSDSNFKDLARI